MRTGWFDCSSGIAGNMILGSLFDAGLNRQEWQQIMARLPLPVKYSLRRVKRQGIGAMLFHTQSLADDAHRGLREIAHLIYRSKFAAVVTDRAISIFERLARAEARVHRTSVDRIHFHEVGGYDCIIDIVGAVIGLWLMGIERLYSSPVNLGRGKVTFSHGTVAVPAPAVAELLKGVPCYQPEPETGELTTPTGAAILRELAAGYGPMPLMQLHSVGYGAGDRSLPEGNVLRLFVGETGSGLPAAAERAVVIETNIDDMNPELLGYCLERLLSAGALDVFFTPIFMKKNRPATLLTVITEPHRLVELSRILLTETTSLGVRYYETDRICLKRTVTSVLTRFGRIRVKTGIIDDQIVTVAPEYESCKAVARKKNLPLRRVYEEVLRAAERSRR